MMRLCFLLNAFETDGPTRATLLLAEEARRCGHWVHLAALQRGGAALPLAAAISSIPPTVLGRGPGLLSAFSGRSALPAMLTRDQPLDGIIAILAAPTLALLSTTLPIPVPRVIVHHGAHEWNERGTAVGWIVRRLMSRFLPKADRHFTVSPFTGTELINRIGSNQLTWEVLGNPMRPAAYQVVPCPPHDQPWRLGGCGRLVPLKNWETLLRALKIIQSRGHLCVVDIVGDGPDRERLRRIAATLGIEDQVIFHGHRDPWIDLAANWHAYVQPSLQESFGLSAAEAASVGLCCVHPDFGALPWTLGPAGWNYGEATNAIGLAERLIDLLSTISENRDQEVFNRAQRRNWILEKYSPPQIWQLMEKSLLSLKFESSSP